MRISAEEKIFSIQKRALDRGLDIWVLKQLLQNYTYHNEITFRRKKIVVIAIFTVFVSFVFSMNVWNRVFFARCLLPSNFLVWEVTRPIADCSYCFNVTKPIILQNVTRQSFLGYTYTSKPIVVKNAIKNWKAMNAFSFDMFKNIFEQTVGSYNSFDDGCQFLNFKTNLFTLEEVFTMSEHRARNDPGQEPWYVGWSNCHPNILNNLRQYYSVPDFLPNDAEFPATENIFFGYEIGAVMHLDYIPRLMWQGQVKGNKMWHLAPVTECEHVCDKIKFCVEPGDIVMLDTRIWYHSTSIPKGEFSITVQSEYG